MRLLRFVAIAVMACLAVAAPAEAKVKGTGSFSVGTNSFLLDGSLL